MTKKQLHEEHTRLITDFRQPRLNVTVKPYSYSHFRTLVDKDYTQKDIKTITSMYVMQQLQDSVVVNIPARDWTAETRCYSPLERAAPLVLEDNFKKQDLMNLEYLKDKPRWKFR